MDKKRIEVVINGQTHIFVTEDSEKYIKDLAEYLNKKISEVAGTSFGNLLSNEKKYIVAAMNILDDYFKLLPKYEAIREKGEMAKEREQNISQEYEKRIDEYEKKIKSIQRENDKLTDKISNLEYEFNYVQNLYKEQKQEYEQLLEDATKPDR